jgi:hypothetical protein
MNVDLPAALNQIERSSHDILGALIHSWLLGSSLILNDDVFRTRAMTPAETRIQQHFLTGLTLLAEFIEQRTRHFGANELTQFRLQRDRLLELKQRRSSAESTIVPIELNKAMVSFFLSQWRPWTEERKDMVL